MMSLRRIFSFTQAGTPLCFFSVIWFAAWLWFITVTFHEEIKYYQFALKASLEELHAVHAAYDENSEDYFKILMFCDRLLPGREPLQLILPQAHQQEFEFLREKGRYILYPRNYGENTILRNHILVYNVNEWVIPDGYKMSMNFGPGKYLLTRLDHPRRGD